MRLKALVMRIEMLVLLTCAVTVLVFLQCKGEKQVPKKPKPAETVEVVHCDGKKIELPSELEGRALAGALMDQWQRDHPERDWVALEKMSHKIVPGADNASLLAQGQGDKGHTYGKYTDKNLLIWDRETEKFVVEGSRIFHSGDELESTVGVSCDMCHPDASNTHPETYPKFQVQLGKTVLLRDMINWCIENPVRGTPLAADDPKMRAMEAYIYAQRRGVKLNYNQH
jgi:thiosulfate dehydrogenase